MGRMDRSTCDTYLQHASVRGLRMLVLGLRYSWMCSFFYHIPWYTGTGGRGARAAADMQIFLRVFSIEPSASTCTQQVCRCSLSGQAAADMESKILYLLWRFVVLSSRWWMVACDVAIYSSNSALPGTYVGGGRSMTAGERRGK